MASNVEEEIRGRGNHEKHPSVDRIAERIAEQKRLLQIKEGDFDKFCYGCGGGLPNRGEYHPRRFCTTVPRLRGAEALIVHSCGGTIQRKLFHRAEDCPAKTPLDNKEAEKKDEGQPVDEMKQTRTAEQLRRVVRVDGVERSLGQDVVEDHFCREYEGVESVDRPIKGPSYDVTFKDENLANAFLEKKDLKLQEKQLTAQLLMSFIQTKIIKRQLKLTVSQNQHLMACVPLEAGKEDSYLLVFGIGRPSEEELQKYFLSQKSGFEGIVSVKSVETISCDGPNGKLLGTLLQFESNAALVKFTQLKEVKYKGHTLRYKNMCEVIRNIQVQNKKANFVVDDGPNTQQLADRRIVLLRRKGEFDPVEEQILKAHFPDAKGMRHFPVEQLTVLTFPSIAAAQQAVRAGDECDLMKPVTVLMLAEYLEKRQEIMAEKSGRMEELKMKYENIKNNFVKVKGNTITITDPDPKPEPETGTKDTFKEAMEALVAKPGVALANPILRKRVSRGPNAFDLFVGVKGFAQHIKSIGKVSDMDICNYFIHNHKDVADVRFVNWTDVIFAKFKSVGAAEQFITLNYHLFYGVELMLLDVPTFLAKTKKSDQQEDVAKILLGKKFNESMVKDL